jgi:hypothetical protein
MAKVNEAKSSTMFLTRRVYDALVAKHADYMAHGEYQKLDRKWSINGVRVIGTIAQVSELQAKIGG